MKADSENTEAEVGRPKVFVLGYGGCGTTALHYFFRNSGLASLHHKHRNVPVAPDMLDNIKAGRRVIAGYEQYDAFSDLEYLCEHRRVEIADHFDLLLEQEPGAKFILNVRDRERWVESRMRHRNRHRRLRLVDLGWGGADRPCPPGRSLESCRTNDSYAGNYRRYYGLANMKQARAHMRVTWDHHLSAVQKRVPPNRLLVFNIEDDDPVLLCRFLGLPDEMARHYTQSNRAAEPTTLRCRTSWALWRLRRSLPPAMQRCATRWPGSGRAKRIIQAWLQRR